MVRFVWFAALLGGLVAQATGGLPQATATPPDFQTDVFPRLRVHCVRCHGPEASQAGVRLDNLSADLFADRRAAEQWQEVVRVLQAGEMPPEDEEPLPAADRQTLVDAISAAIERAVEAQQSTGGRGLPRRLNRNEYQQTMTDLLGLEMDYRRDLPPDPFSEDGFQNDGQALQMSALQLEVYLATARRALQRVIVEGPAPEVFEQTFTESNVRGWLRGIERANRLGRQQAFLATMIDDYPEAGRFQIEIRLKAELPPQAGFPLLEVSVGYRPDTQVLFRPVEVVEITSEETQTLHFAGRLENHPLPVRGQGKYPGLVIRLRNLYDDGSDLPAGEKEKGKGIAYPEEANLPSVTIESLRFQGPVFTSWPPQAHRRILFDSPRRSSDERAYVAAVMKRFMRRAFRRPVRDPEVASMVDFFSTIRDDFPSFEAAIRETLAMVLIRPEFLYLWEPAGEQKRRLNDWELASRLSYFLWSTMPDRSLRKLAAAGSLHEPAVLSQQVTRMLDDPRAVRFSDAFTNQWLQLDVIDRVAVSRQRYPDFDERLKGDMRAETQAFFKELLDHDLNAMQLLASGFAMLNEPLAKHYGVPGVWGTAMRRVTLPADSHRGGLLGQAGILLSNSTGSDSHPVRRAVWIRDRLLDDPPAPPPPDVPSLDEADPQFLELPVREQLEIHRGTEACAACHRDIDPWGIALEQFDAVGQWRAARESASAKEDAGNEGVPHPIDASAVLPDGTRLGGSDGLKEYLVNHRQEAFARSLVKRLLTYALGRRLEMTDRETIEALTAQFSEDQYRLRPLLQNIVGSSLFQTK